MQFVQFPTHHVNKSPQVPEIQAKLVAAHNGTYEKLRKYVCMYQANR